MASTTTFSLCPALRRGRTAWLLAATAIALWCAVAGTAGAATTPAFTNYPAPPPLGQDAGEPSIGIDWKTDQVLYQAGLQTLKVDFSSAAPAWRDVSSTITSLQGLDPILFTDHSTGRTFVSQLLGACSLMAFSDDDGASWTQNPLGCGIGAAADHQTVGGGPFHVGVLGPLTGYQHSVYYCAQAVVSAQCSVSQTGGAVFDPATSIYNMTQCNGLHGHLKVGPDGTAYVPNADCGGLAAAVTSTDNGLTWKADAVPGSSTQDESDPSIGVGSGGSVYLGYQGKDGHAYISVKRPGGTWTTPTDVGAALGIQNVQFPAVVAGDDDRASFAFLGTTTGGDDQAATFAGAWHLYVATTYDGGASWSTVDATPTDPVQRGCIWLGGGSNTCRNLLDFIGSEIDSHGQVHVAYADGCTASCPSGGTNTHSALATIARQTAGTGLLSAFDPPLATPASTPSGGH
ncbi:MAG: hypothetical protein QOF86_1347 [Baekduia sp.]|nr:hypothetical protein [Baekduia sp.]